MVQTGPKWDTEIRENMGLYQDYATSIFAFTESIWATIGTGSKHSGC